MSPSVRSSRWHAALTTLFALVAGGCVAMLLAALVGGYRPVVITTGSMGDAAPTGSLVVAAPTAAAGIEVGDIVVMRRPGSAPVTHRVIQIDDTGSGPFAITQGDANPAPDAAPYPLTGDELVGRWVVPHLGTMLEAFRSPLTALAALAVVLLAATVYAVRKIWSGDDEHGPDPGRQQPDDSAATSRSRASVVGGATFAVLLVLLGAGVAWSLYSSSQAVGSNSFGTSDCFDARLESIQSGETVHAVDGIVFEPITAVDLSRSFVTASVRSADNEIADSSVRVRLAGAGMIEIRRQTDAGSPPAVSVAWSVVEYGCGIDVQRGVVVGNGTNQIDVPITTVDTSSSFVVVNSMAPSTAADFGAEELFIGELTAADTLSIRAASSAVFPVGQSFAWQVVTFDDPADVEVQTASTTIGAGTTSDTITLATPVDLGTTFLTTSVASDSAGPDIGERLVRAHLVDPTTVAIDRSVGGDALEIHVQAVTLRDGSTVRHGTIDLPVGTASDTVTVGPVDVTRSTAISTVAIPGPSAGGMTDHVADDVVGEASATFVITDPTTVTVTRDATASNSSFGWQVIEWAGPDWWDPAYGFRRRIDVDAASTAVPAEYTVPLTIDHATLVSSGLSRADGDDLRIVRWDGASWTELDRVLDDDAAWNRVDTTVWFRTTDPIASDQTHFYWLYLGNPAATPAPSDPEAVYLLTENFDAGGLGDFEDRTGGTGWYSAAPWTKRIPVTVPAGQVAAALTDFPLLVSLTDADLGLTAQPDGSDIRFTAGDGTTDLPHEIESFDSGSGTLTAWVRLPTLSDVAPTTVYLYYGASDAPAREDVHGTWRDDVEAVWHLDRDPAGSAPQLDDSSANNHDGLSVGAMTAGDLVPGLVGDGLDLDGGDDGAEADALVLQGAAGITISGWVRLNSLTDGDRIFSKADDLTNRQVDLAVMNDGSVRARLLLDSGEVVATTAAATVSTGGWHHIAATWDRSDLAIVVDGTSRASVGTTGVIDPRPAMPVHVGNVATQDRGLDGLLDEVRVETAARAIDWLAAAEDNQRTPASFHTVGGVESGTWFGQGSWSARKPVTVDSDQVAADLFDYPLLVQVADAQLQASAQACACDLVFTGADGTTRLDHVVEAYDSGTGALTAWVSVPVLSGSEDTSLFLYYGNPTAVDQQDPSAVFGSDADLQMLGAP